MDTTTINNKKKLYIGHLNAICPLFWMLRVNAQAQWAVLQLKVQDICGHQSKAVVKYRTKCEVKMCLFASWALCRMALKIKTQTASMVQRQRKNLCSGKTPDGLSSSPFSTPTSGRCTSRHRHLSGQWRRYVSILLY